MRVRQGMRDALWFISAISVTVTAIPVIFIIYYGFFVYNDAAKYGSTILMSIALTLFSSGIASLVIFTVFTPLSYELSRRSHAIWETVTDIPASIPHPIVGIAFLIIGSPITPFGRFLSSIGLGLFDSIQGLILALSFIAMPVYIRSAQSVFTSRSIEPELYALSMGASRLRILYSVVVAGSLREVVSAILTSMSRAMSEFGSIAILSYYVLQSPFRGVQPAPVLIYQYYGYYGPGVAISASAVMIIFSLIVLIVIRLISFRGRTRTDSGTEKLLRGGF